MKFRKINHLVVAKNDAIFSLSTGTTKACQAVNKEAVIREARDLPKTTIKLKWLTETSITRMKKKKERVGTWIPSRNSTRNRLKSSDFQEAINTKPSTLT